MQNTKAQADLLPRLSLPQNVKQAYLELGGLPELDGRYTVFGQVYQGLEIVAAIAAQPTNSEDAPIEPVFIRQLTSKKHRKKTLTDFSKSSILELAAASECLSFIHKIKLGFNK